MCDSHIFAYSFPFASSSPCVPSSTTLPPFTTKILSAPAMVDSRWAITISVFPCTSLATPA